MLDNYMDKSVNHTMSSGFVAFGVQNYYSHAYLVVQAVIRAYMSADATFSEVFCHYCRFVTCWHMTPLIFINCLQNCSSFLHGC